MRTRPRERPAALALGASRMWTAALADARRMEAVAPLHVVRYERLHASPVATVLELFAFCGIPCDESRAREIADANAFDRLAHTGPDRFRRGGRTGDWRTQLGAVSRGVVHAVAGSDLIAQGYIARPGPRCACRAGLSRHQAVAQAAQRMTPARLALLRPQQKGSGHHGDPYRAAVDGEVGSARRRLARQVLQQPAQAWQIEDLAG